MKKDELLSVLSKMEPDDELKENTKLKMMNIAMTRGSEKQKRPNLFAKMSTTICAAALALVCISSFNGFVKCHLKFATRKQPTINIKLRLHMCVLFYQKILNGLTAIYHFPWESLCC